MRFFSLPNTGKKVGRKSVVEFLIRLCNDVLLDVLRWGNRYELAELETSGRRFHWLIDRNFKEMPFLRLDLEIISPYLLPYFFNIKFR